MSRIILAVAVATSLIAAPRAQTPDAGTITGLVKLKPRVGGAALPVSGGADVPSFRAATKRRGVSV